MNAANDITTKLSQAITVFGAEWVMWLLVGLSVISVAVVLERLWFYRRRRVDVTGLAAEVADHLERGDHEGARRALDTAGRHGALEAAVARDMLDALARGPVIAEQRMLRALARERTAYERGLSFLGTLGNNAPFVGLFGTVLGIIKAFADLAGNVQGGADVVMAGISEALVATAIGLLVALPAVMMFNVFQGRLKRILRGADLVARTVLDFVRPAGEVA